ncbi:HAD hydrolase-like protein [Gammaproteobacteria bacterium]|nr:HAD hydrolase-like protein [Gammaproteobacteria bacterium]
MISEPVLDFDTAWRCYIEHHSAPLPQGDAAAMVEVSSLLDCLDGIRVLLLDGYGVLNVGSTAVSGMDAVLREAEARGIASYVLTNGATLPAERAFAKYPALGYETLRLDRLVSSRMVTIDALARHAVETPNFVWGLPDDGVTPIDDLPGRIERVSTPAQYDAVDGLLLLSTVGWHGLNLHQRVFASLTERPRPLWIGNPDVTAPVDGAFSTEPGYYGRIASELDGVAVSYFGKPSRATYDYSMDYIARQFPDIERHQVLMVGDSPHTDILGARLSGLPSVLMTDHGLLAGRDWRGYLQQAQIWPDWLLSGEQ